MASKKQLSVRQAANCEEAQEPVCKCRCGGALHGARRNGSAPADATFFSTLPEDDPHRIVTPQQRREAERLRRQAAWERIYQKQLEYDEMVRDSGMWDL